MRATTVPLILMLAAAGVAPAHAAEGLEIRHWSNDDCSGEPTETVKNWGGVCTIGGLSAGPAWVIPTGCSPGNITVKRFAKANCTGHSTIQSDSFPVGCESVPPDESFLFTCLAGSSGGGGGGGGGGLGGGLGGGAIAGIVIAVLVVVGGAVAAAVYFLVIRPKQHATNKYESEVARYELSANQ